MTIFIGTDHRGFALKNKLIDYLQSKNIRVEDMGNYDYDPEDDHPDFAQKVAEAVLQNPKEYMGIVICGSGVGVSIAANRFKGIRCALGFSEEQVQHGRTFDIANVLALPADFIGYEKARSLVDSFLSATPTDVAKYMRRTMKLDS